MAFIGVISIMKINSISSPTFGATIKESSALKTAVGWCWDGNNETKLISGFKKVHNILPLDSDTIEITSCKHHMPSKDASEESLSHTGDYFVRGTIKSGELRKDFSTFLKPILVFSLDDNYIEKTANKNRVNLTTTILRTAKAMDNKKQTPDLESIVNAIVDKK